MLNAKQRDKIQREEMPKEVRDMLHGSIDAYFDMKPKGILTYDGAAFDLKHYKHESERLRNEIHKTLNELDEACLNTL